jgi:hypothetical protein
MFPPAVEDSIYVDDRIQYTGTIKTQHRAFFLDTIVTQGTPSLELHPCEEKTSLIDRDPFPLMDLLFELTEFTNCNILPVIESYRPADQIFDKNLKRSYGMSFKKY